MAETLCSQCRGLGLIPGWETRSHVLPLKIPNGRTKTWCRGREGGREREKEKGEKGGGSKGGARISISLRCISCLPLQSPSPGREKQEVAQGKWHRRAGLSPQAAGVRSAVHLAECSTSRESTEVQGGPQLP